MPIGSRRRRIATALTASAGCALLVLGSAARAGPQGDNTPESFAFAIGNGNLAGPPEVVAERLGGFDLVIVDGEEAGADELAAVRERRTIVLGYLSVGTIEKWRSWYPLLRRFRLGASRDWKEEWFADVSARGLRRRLTRRIAPELLSKGFDGLFLDNVDMIESRAHRPQRRGMTKLVAALGRLVHADGRLLFAQNGHGILARLGIVESLDGWNREDVTWTYDFERRRYVRNRGTEIRAAQEELRDFAGRGLVVTATDYTRADDDAALEEAVANACSAGALPYVSDIGLTAARLPDPPLRCTTR